MKQFKRLRSLFLGIFILERDDTFLTIFRLGFGKTIEGSDTVWFALRIIKSYRTRRWWGSVQILSRRFYFKKPPSEIFKPLESV